MRAGWRWLGRFAAALLGAVMLAAAGPPPEQRQAPPPEQRQGPPPEQRALPRADEKRIALVVGNGAYQHTAPLANPRNDAEDVAAALERTGFEVIVALDASKAAMDGALRAFADKLAGADVALFYYAGHGLQVGNENYLVPVEARLARERDLAFEAVRLDFVLRQMEIDREGKTTIVMLDACRDNPLTRNLARSMGTRSTAIGQGLAPASTGVGTFIAYSTQPGNVALDGKGRNSPFTAALVQHLGAPGRNLNATMIAVRRAVIGATEGRQVPWDHSALTGEFYFVPRASAAPAVRTGTSVAAPPARSDDVEALRARLKALEEAEKRRAATAAAAPAPRGTAAGGSAAGAERIIQLAELKARLAIADDKAKALQRRLLEARRTEGQARDPAERTRLLQDSIRIQGDMTREFGLAKRLRDQIAALDAAPAAPAASPQPAAAAATRSGGLQPSRSERGYDIYDGAEIVGTEIKRGSGDSVNGCISMCRNTRGCVAAMRVLTAPVQSACVAFSAVERIRTDESGRVVAIRLDATEGVAGAGPAFDVVDNLRLEGELLRAAFRAQSPDACRLTCMGEAGCVAFQHGRRAPVHGQCQLFSSVTTRHEDRAWRAGVRAGGQR